MAHTSLQTPGSETPSSARIHNLWLGGSFYTAADEAKAAEIEAVCPQVRQMAADSRLFTARVTAWAAAELGITRFLDLGAGVVPGPAVHDMARSVQPRAQVAYADLDPEVCDYLADVMPGGSGDGIAVARADLSRPGEVLSHHAVRKVIDPAAPVCVLATLVLQGWSPPRARAVVRGYARLLAPGSIIAVSTQRVGDELARGRLAKAYAPFRAHDFTAAQVAGLFDELDLVPPGVGAAFALRPGWTGVPCKRRGTAYVLGAVGAVRR